ncbi:MAG: tRNA (adenosine(37)-N6)-dimethylallyltransferase MiaA, partial [Caldithrix sp.]|nr:tRNA (adenosine(37)-N6)-dimethylallyltransferase MiaA [Caldithrix sp.]
DEPYAQKVSSNDAKRIVRALEVFYLSGQPFSQWHRQQADPPNFHPFFIGLIMDRQQLYDRINARVDAMIKAGLIEEVQSLKKSGYHPGMNALNTVGYKEVFDYLNGQYPKEDMIEAIKRHSRQFAKRQLTWFRKDQRIQWLEIDDRLRTVSQKMADLLKKRLSYD